NTVMEHIRQTEIDGILVDEWLFMTPAFCGCASCRKFFTEDTGYQLPADELSKDLNNPKSALWRTWEEWRRRKIGEFWLNLRKKVAEYRKDFIFIGYTTEYGLTGNWATNDMGSDIFNYARSWDMIGTEIMPRNVFACARAMNSTRKAFSVFNRNGNTPVFGLVYANDWKIKYFGWAMNNLNAQQTWETRFIPCPAGEVNFRTFTVDKGNMDLTKAKSAAKTALLFSETSRNMAGSFPAAGAYRREIFGTAQMLEQLHIDYDMISEEDLTAEKLAKYSVLVLGNSPYLSDKYLAVIMDFMKNGGTVSASYMTGICNEFGKLRTNDLAGTIFGWKGSAKGPAGAEIAAIAIDGKTGVKPLRSIQFRRMPSLPVKDSEAAFVTKANRKLPAVISKKVGKGKFVYYPGMYGSGNCSNYLMVGSKHTFQPDLALEKFQKKLLSDLLDNTRTWQADNLPEEVFSASYTQDNKFVVHFLNAVNSMPEVGKVVGYYLDKTAFPKLDTFTVTVPFKVKKAYAVSPEFSGSKALNVEVKNSASKVTVPGGLFKVYSLIYLEK
ncbi:MAG: beta-galactosidase trimerization domain-containing protein, partial [Lentisphaeria bacterium]|nr:beta-galactosidase trimerization domain-containing protein [Lentisphaeria bacterium]